MDWCPCTDLGEGQEGPQPPLFWRILHFKIDEKNTEMNIEMLFSGPLFLELGSCPPFFNFLDLPRCPVQGGHTLHYRKQRLSVGLMSHKFGSGKYLATDFQGRSKSGNIELSRNFKNCGNSSLKRISSNSAKLS